MRAIYKLLCLISISSLIAGCATPHKVESTSSQVHQYNREEVKAGKLYLSPVFDNSIRVYWLALNGKRYSLYSTNKPITDGEWEKILEVTGQGIVFNYIDSISVNSKFYKLNSK